MVNEEKRVQEARQRAFLDKSFAPSQHSPPFPYCWRANIGLAYGKGTSRAVGEIVPNRPLQKMTISSIGRDKIQGILSSTKPCLNQTTEDGTRYRIYQKGDLEVRTIQEEGGQESIGAVFTMGKLSSGKKIRDSEKIVRATELVQAVPQVNGNGELAECRYQAILETASKDTIFTEMLADGTVVWEENPNGLEQIHAASKVLNCMDGIRSGTTIAQMREYRDGNATSPSTCKSYARGICSRANGEHKTGSRTKSNR